MRVSFCLLQACESAHSIKLVHGLISFVAELFGLLQADQRFFPWTVSFPAIFRVIRAVRLQQENSVVLADMSSYCKNESNQMKIFFSPISAQWIRAPGLENAGVTGTGTAGLH